MTCFGGLHSFLELEYSQVLVGRDPKQVGYSFDIASHITLSQAYPALMIVRRKSNNELSAVNKSLLVGVRSSVPTLLGEWPTLPSVSNPP